MNNADTLPDMTQQIAPSLSREAIADARVEKSWGEKYKSGLLHFIRDILVNYVINFFGSAVFAYEVERSKLGGWFNKIIKQASDKGVDYKIPRGLTSFVASFFTRTQLLLCGGHILLPFMKWTHDNKKKLEMKIGRALDTLQGGEAAARSLKEYDRVEQLMKAGNPANLTENDKALLAKHGVNEKLEFTDHRKTWKEVIMARLNGMAITTTMGIAMGISSSLEKYPKLQFRETYEKPAGKWIGDKLLAKIPFFGPRIGDRAHLGANMLDEILFTLGSKIGFDFREKKQQEAYENGNDKQELEKDKKFLAETGIRPEDAADIHTQRSPVSYAAKETKASSYTTAREQEREAMRDGAAIGAA